MKHGYSTIVRSRTKSNLLMYHLQRFKNQTTLSVLFARHINNLPYHLHSTIQTFSNLVFNTQLKTEFQKTVQTFTNCSTANIEVLKHRLCKTEFTSGETFLCNHRIKMILISLYGLKTQRHEWVRDNRDGLVQKNHISSWMTLECVWNEH